MLFDIPQMGVTCPGDGLTIGQLLDALRERFTFIRNKPTELSLHEALVYEQRVYDVLICARTFVNSFQVAVRAPPEVLGMVASYLTEEGLFSTSQVCRYWRSVLTSSPSLWTRISFRRVPRMIVSLERCRSLPIQLRVERPFSDVVLDDILLHGKKVVSLTVNHRPYEVPRLHQLLTSSGPHLERLHICVQSLWGQVTQEPTMDEVWKGLPSLRKLFVNRYSFPVDQLAAPNLIHLALDHAGHGQNVTVETILDMLRQFPLLETLLLAYSEILPTRTAHDHSQLCLPHLRSIEVGTHEIRCGLVTHLDFPKNITAGFRVMRLSDTLGDIPPAVTAAMQHVLGRIDIDRITLAMAPNLRAKGNMKLLVRLEGPQDSLEMNIGSIRPAKLPALFGPHGVLFPHKSRFEDVKELHIINCSLDDIQELHPLTVAMPNVVSISFSNCSGTHMSELLAPSHPSSPPFPHLERVMVLGGESGLEGMARRRRELGVRLKALFIGPGPEPSRRGRRGDYTMLKGLVDELQVGCPVQTLEWGARNEIANVWSTVIAPGQWDFNERGRAFKFYRFNVSGGCRI